MRLGAPGLGLAWPCQSLCRLGAAMGWQGALEMGELLAPMWSQCRHKRYVTKKENEKA